MPSDTPTPLAALREKWIREFDDAAEKAERWAAQQEEEGLPDMAARTRESVVRARAIADALRFQMEHPASDAPTPAGERVEAARAELMGARIDETTWTRDWFTSRITAFENAVRAECAAALRAAPRGERASTHWEGCWREHHACAIKHIERTAHPGAPDE